MSSVCGKCFFKLSELRQVRCSLDDEFVATFIHAFVTSRLDYCNSLLIGTHRTTTDKLQLVKNAAARVITNTWKSDSGLTHARCHDLTPCYTSTERLCIQMSAPLIHYSSEQSGNKTSASCAQCKHFRRLYVPQCQSSSCVACTTRGA